MLHEVPLTLTQIPFFFFSLTQIPLTLTQILLTLVHANPEAGRPLIHSLMPVFDGQTGEIVHTEQISDFQEQSERKLEIYTDMFDDLYSLENRLLGIFVPRHIRATRYLFK